jgi:hypothetical protein
VRVPSVAEEDDRRLHRERDRLIAERIQHVDDAPSSLGSARAESFNGKRPIGGAAPPTDLDSATARLDLLTSMHGRPDQKKTPDDAEKRGDDCVTHKLMAPRQMVRDLLSSHARSFVMFSLIFSFAVCSTHPISTP